MIITYDILRSPPPPLLPRALLDQNTRHVWVDGRVLVGGGMCFGGAVEAAALPDDARIVDIFRSHRDG